MAIDILIAEDEPSILESLDFILRRAGWSISSVTDGDAVLEGHKQDTPVSPRYDVVYLQDARGWYYRYSHLKEIDKRLAPGRVVKMGERIGLLGKEGGSGGWSHLHFEIKSRQPSGKWGTQEGYAFLFEAIVRGSLATPNSTSASSKLRRISPIASSIFSSERVVLPRNLSRALLKPSLRTSNMPLSLRYR